MNSTVAFNIYSLVAQLSSAEAAASVATVPLYNEILERVAKGEKLTFVLPAFPAKSANRDKTLSAEPDYAEVLGLVAINSVCQQIQQIHPAGAEIVICSDGRVFNDLVMVSDENLMKYKLGIKQIIRDLGLEHLKTFCLDDCYSHQDFSQMRKDLEVNFSESVESIRERVKSSAETCALFNGIHRFIKEDMRALRPELSGNQLMKEAKRVTYQVMQRSGAWDQLTARYFPNALRLSIHPYPVTHRKFGIKLVGGADRWATPWHNVALKIENRFCLVKRSQALEMGATLDYAEGSYAFYHVS